MKAYNVEIFTPEFAYKSSVQIAKIEYEYDYLDITKNNIETPKIIDVEKGDYIRIRKSGVEITGIVSDCNGKKNGIKIEYKPFHKLFDVDFYVEEQGEKSLEKWLEEIISGMYIHSEDSLQNIPMEIELLTESSGSLGIEAGVRNVFEIIKEAFTSYGIVITTTFDMKIKKLKITIGKCKAKDFKIEADLKNIIDKNIVIKEARETTNKLYIYNEENPEEKIIYYKNINDEITAENTGRVFPVVFDSVAVKVSGKKTFEEVAQTKAKTVIKASKYENLIEITVLAGDLIVRPEERKIGQNVTVISSGIEYHSILTGYEVKDDGEYILIFGAIRLELTKELKKWRTKIYD